MSSLRKRLVAILTGAIMVGSSLTTAVPSSASASTLQVTNCDDSGNGSLRAQVAAAASGDTVMLDATTMGCSKIVLQSALVISGKSITITGSTKNIANHLGDMRSPYTSNDAMVLPEVTISRGGSGSSVSGAYLRQTSTGMECVEDYSGTNCSSSIYGNDIALLTVAENVESLDVNNIIFSGASRNKDPYVSGDKTYFTPATNPLVTITGQSTSEILREVNFTNTEFRDAYRSDGGAAGVQVESDAIGFPTVYSLSLNFNKSLFYNLKAGGTSNGAAVNVQKKYTLLNFTHTIVRANMAWGEKGGAVYVNAGSTAPFRAVIELSNSDFSYNVAKKYGGAIAAQGLYRFTAANSAFIRNSLNLPCDYTDCWSPSQSSDVSDASLTQYGAGVYLNDVTTAQFVASQFVRNHVSENTYKIHYGGAIYVGTTNHTDTQHLTIEGSAFFSNLPAYNTGRSQTHGTDVAAPDASDFSIISSSFGSEASGSSYNGSFGNIGIYTGSPLTKILNSAFKGGAPKAVYPDTATSFEAANANARIYAAASIFDLSESGSPCGTSSWVTDAGANIWAGNSKNCVPAVSVDSFDASLTGSGLGFSTFVSAMTYLQDIYYANINDTYWSSNFYNESVTRYGKASFLPPQMYPTSSAKAVNFYLPSKTFVLGPDGTTAVTSPQFTGRGVTKAIDSKFDAGPTEYFEVTWEVKNDQGVVQTNYSINQSGIGQKATIKATYPVALANLPVVAGTIGSNNTCPVAVFKLSDFATPKQIDPADFLCDPFAEQILWFRAVDRAMGDTQTWNAYNAFYNKVDTGGNTSSWEPGYAAMSWKSKLATDLTLIPTSSSSVIATWTGSTSATSYVVQNYDGSKSCTVNPPATSCELTGLSPSDSPLYLRTTIGQTQQSLSSSQSSSKTYAYWMAPSGSLTGKPTATVNTATGTISASVPYDYDNSSVYIYSDPAGMSCVTSGTVCNFTTGFTSGTSYTFKYSAKPGYRWTEPSAASNSVTAPAAKTSITPATGNYVSGSTGQALFMTNDPFTANNFVGAVTYTISPALPAGLTINSSTGVIGGIPTAVKARTVYTVTATGATSGSATATVTVTITATAGYVPTPDPTGDPDAELGTSVNAGGGKITISGTNLAGVSSVTVGGTNATFVKNSNGTITITLPAGTTGTANVVLGYGSGAYAGTVTAGTVTYVGATKLAQTIGLEVGDDNFQLGDDPRTVTVTSKFADDSDTGLTVTVVSLTPKVCTYANGEITFIAAGKCTIKATQAGDSGTSAATAVEKSIYAVPSIATIDPLYALDAGNVNMTIKGTGLTSITKVYLGTVEIVAPNLKPSADGKSLVVVIPAAGANAGQSLDLKYDYSGHDGSIDTGHDFTYVGTTKLNQTITLEPGAPLSTYGDEPRDFEPVSKNGTDVLDVNLVITNVTPKVCVVVNGQLKFLASGTCTVKTSQAGNAGVNKATDVVTTIQVSKKAQSMTLVSSSTASITDATPGQIVVDLSSDEDGMVPDYASSNELVCVVDDTGVVTGLTAGTCTITISQPGDARYSAVSPNLTVTITVTLDPTTLVPESVDEEDSGDPAAITGQGPNVFLPTNDGNFQLAWDPATGKLFAKSYGVLIGYIQGTISFTVDNVSYSCEIVFGNTSKMLKKTAAQRKAIKARKYFVAKTAFCADASKMSVPTGLLSIKTNWAKVKKVAKTKAEKTAEATALTKLKGFSGEVRVTVKRFRAWPTTMLNYNGDNAKGRLIPTNTRRTVVNLQ